MSNQNQKIESQKTETKISSVSNKSGQVVTTIIFTVFTLFVALVIGLPIYLYIPLLAIVFFSLALGFYLFSFRSKIKRLESEIEVLKTSPENYHKPPPPPKF